MLIGSKWEQQFWKLATKAHSDSTAATKAFEIATAAAQEVYRSGGEHCAVCGEWFHGEWPYEALGVCGGCTEVLWNLFIHRHGGHFPTWANTQHPTRGFKKALVPEDLRWDVFKRDGNKCVECGSHRRLTIDHNVPEFRGGETTAENLQTLCKKCNSKKGKKTQEEWKALQA